MTTPETTPEVNVDAARNALAEVFGNPWTARDVGEHFSCGEAECVATALTALGMPDVAASWLKAHGQGDDEGDDHYQGNGPRTSRS